MDRVHAEGDGRRDDAAAVEVALRRGRLADADRVVGGAHRQRVHVGLGRDRHRLDAALAACPNDAHCDLAAVGDEHAPDSPVGHRPMTQASGSMTTSGCPSWTAWLSATRIWRTVPRTLAGIEFMSFITSMMQTTLSASTCWPTSTNGVAPGVGATVERAEHRRSDGHASGHVAGGVGAGAAAGEVAGDRAGAAVVRQRLPSGAGAAPPAVAAAGSSVVAPPSREYAISMSP